MHKFLQKLVYGKNKKKKTEPFLEGNKNILAGSTPIGKYVKQSINSLFYHFDKGDFGDLVSFPVHESISDSKST